ncbi:hypothetical protein KUW09_13790 [Mameliella alba]|nr:hypothetical protein [Antarctobacter heliothermus]MBY6145125.1 hypothetical protein [Mameliella alba]
MARGVTKQRMAKMRGNSAAMIRAGLSPNRLTGLPLGGLVLTRPDTAQTKTASLLCTINRQGAAAPVVLHRFPLAYDTSQTGPAFSSGNKGPYWGLERLQ